MSAYLLRRFGQGLLVLWAAFTLTFFLLQVLPGDAVLIKFQNPDLGLSPAQIAEMRLAYGAIARCGASTCTRCWRCCTATSAIPCRRVWRSAV